MKKMIFYWLFVGVLFVLSSCQGYTVKNTPDEYLLPKGEGIKTSNFVHANNAFARELFATMTEFDSSENIFIAPVSISSCLAMVYAGSDGETEAEIGSVMNWSQNSKTFHQSYSEYLSELNASQSKKYSLKIANGLFFQKGMELYQEFVDVNKEQYQSQVQVLDFNNSESAADKVNSWVGEKTDSMVLDFVKPDQLGNTKMLTVNAVAFVGGWMDVFDRNKTREDEFYGVKEVVAVDYMDRYWKKKVLHQSSIDAMVENGLSMDEIFAKKPRYKRSYNETFQVLELPYANGEASMIIFLPHKVNYYSFGDISLLEIDTLIAALDTLSDEAEVKIRIPKFKLVYENDLKPSLQKMGLNHAFSDEANFNRETSDIKLSLGKILHKTAIEVNEEGTAAAGLTAAESLTLSYKQDPNKIEFHATHPFLYLIRDNKTGTILFMGQYMQPVSKDLSTHQ